MTDHDDDHDPDDDEDELNGELPGVDGLDLPGGPADLDPDDDLPDGLDIDLGVSGEVSTPPGENGEGLPEHGGGGDDGDGDGDEPLPDAPAQPVDEPSLNTLDFARPDDLDEGDAPDLDVTDELRVPARYQAIVESREHAREAFRNTTRWRVEVMSGLSIRDREERAEAATRLCNSRLRDAVEAYIMELEPLLTSCEAGERYWIELPLGEIEFPELEAVADLGGRGRRGPVEQTLAPDPVPITGLAGYLEAPGTFERSITAEVEPRGMDYGSKTVTDSAEKVMPSDVSRRAFRACNQFCSDVGLDLSPSEDDVVKAFDWER
jgi:hypothetical protein